MGIEDNFLIQVGDNGHDKNQLNVGYGTPVDGQETNARGSIYVERPLLNTGQWCHIAVTFDAVNHERGRIEIYVDGVLVASIDEATTPRHGWKLNFLKNNGYTTYYNNFFNHML